MASDVPRAKALLNAHQHERTRPNAAGAAIVSVVTGPRLAARQVFASWSADHNLQHIVPVARDVGEIRQVLRAFDRGCAVLFVPAAAEVPVALRAALELAQTEPQRPIAVAMTVSELEATLRPEALVNSEVRRALLGGLVFATAKAERDAEHIEAQRKQLYRSTHENALHILMREHQDIGDLFSVNQRVRPAPARTSFEIDFWAESLRLAVEVDGLQHGTTAQRKRDDRRDRALAAAGIRVLRIHASKVISDPTAALNQIAAAIADRKRELNCRGITTN